MQLHQQKGMISLSPPTICNSATSSAGLPSASMMRSHSIRLGSMEVPRSSSGRYPPRVTPAAPHANRAH
ncbi:hypothetical protein EC40967_C0070 [Escherichia coli 4.0967]|uniref:Uncharacterized protein n=1 Tax=Escherichia coli 4.0967 TaxID=869687 RepID=A0AAN4AG13_ECOLX|nr:hypothetical protein EC40967_C0070 [Escherichia coli 4.0967]